MAYINFAIATKTARATALNNAIGASAQIQFYTGSAPASPDSSATGTLLATLTGNAGAFGTVSAGVLTLSTVTGANAVASGTAGYARVSTLGSTAIMDCDVGTSGTSITISSTSITSGTPVAVTGGTITEA
jgi:hypothetical protein